MRVPVYERQVRSTGLPTPYMSDAGASTIAESGQVIARGLDQLGSVIQQVHQKEQDKADIAMMTDLMADTSRIENEITYGPDGMLNRQFDEAKGITETGANLFRDRIKEEVFPKIRNPRVAEVFARTLQPMQSRLELTLMRHEANQNDATFKRNYESALSSESNALANLGVSGDAGQINVSLNRMAGVTLAYLKSQGTTDETVLNEAASNTISGGHETVIDSMIDGDHATRAMDYYELNKEAIVGTRRDEVLKRIKPMAEAQEIQNAANVARTQGGLSAQFAWAEANVQDPVKRERLRGQLVAMQQDDSRARDAADKTTWDKAYTQFAKGGFRVAAVDPSLMADIGYDSEKLYQLEHVHKDIYNRVGDPGKVQRKLDALEVYAKIKSRIIDPDQRDEMLAANISRDYGASLGPALTKELIDLQRAVSTKSDNAAPLEVMTLHEEIMDAAKSASLIPSTQEAKWSTDQQSNFDRLQQSLTQWSKDQTAKTGKAASRDDIRREIARQTVKIKIAPSLSSSWNPFVRAKTTVVGAATPEQMQWAFIPIGDIPAADANRIRNTIASEQRIDPKEVEDSQVEHQALVERLGAATQGPSGTRPVTWKDANISKETQYYIQEAMKGLPKGSSLSIPPQSAPAPPEMVPDSERRMFTEAYKRANNGQLPTEDQVVSAYGARLKRAAGMSK